MIYFNFFFNFILFNYTILYWFCHTSTWIRHRYTRVPHPEPHSLLPPHTIPLGCPSAPAPSIQYHASNLDWWFVSYILYKFQCDSPKSSHPLPLPQSPKDCSIHLCLFCCLTYRVIINCMCENPLLFFRTKNIVLKLTTPSYKALGSIPFRNILRLVLNEQSFVDRKSRCSFKSD